MHKYRYKNAINAKSFVEMSSVEFNPAMDLR